MIACLRITTFAAAVEQPLTPGTLQQPLLIAQYRGGRGKVIAVCQQALQAGVVPPQSLSRARALCPEGQVFLASPQRYRQALTDTLLLLSEYSQWLDPEPRPLQTAVIYMDLGKLKPSVGQQLAVQMMTRLQQRYGLPASMGLAANKFTAHAAAQTAQVGEVKLVLRGEEARFLAPLSIQLLPLHTDAAHRLSLFGLRTLGQIAALPRTALIAQFGKWGGIYHRLASGEDPRRVARYVPEQVEKAVFAFDPPIADRLVLNQALTRLAGQLAGRLETEHLTCGEVTLHLHLERSTQRTETLHLREPQHTSLAFYRAAQQLIGRMAIRAPIQQVDLQVGKLKPQLPRQLSLFDVQKTAYLRTVLLDLAQHYGADRFYTAALNPHPTYLPELRFHLEAIETL